MAQLPIAVSNGNMPIDQEKWAASPANIGYPTFDIIDSDGGVTAENIPVERDARLMALTPQLVVAVCRNAPKSAAAKRLREILGEDEFKRLADTK